MRFQLLTILGLLWLLPGDGWQANPAPVSRHKFIVAAHRGDHVVYPENTLEAYKEAIKNEADYVEIDLRTTKDGELVSMHDGSINRMTDGKGQLKDFTLAELLQLKVESKDTASKQAFRIPTFKQILQLCKNRIGIYLDFKAADPEQAYQMIKEYGMEKQVLVYINSAAQFTGWRKAAPKMPLMLSLPDSVKNTGDMKKFIDQYHPDILDGSYNQYTTDMVALAGEYHIPVWPDIQSAGEGPADWNKALAVGLKGLQTDHPAALVKFLKEKGLR
ncbi:glycerophosphodiester phosphodiesterase family protein [Mucilaginibacter rubeus]|uniref:Glycerophosphodiester phosphodiesterase family protein n=1 Tax=Mucilaginibacter rubeus TaxID=2027860 RepID=A0AAE6MLP6_9SPHI|nr:MULTISPECIES: glycerophosphodiester phosphodiesterase family protein [Mucilaginibacter]QEM07956.1 glycerophosphodiester phosphodiesterase family protein [Mucilaginibacter rubeus]QEM20407.1 glycerophosphodiester phosphodiesterase family protein [Mucilaginibacter gossypii]QTE42870.1 glycerophosphodiester phosphodiesterase family protein [Mucilaginibacter rubeus]QTE49471.1 glycerophosphodiester phosphodiesterase family protein [Mucilaginibacter rubeus]QTE54567.1 glycerophosphodiester phosphodi